ncbi:GYD domain-containing protein [Minwuia thermotolerans]|uniref:GYD domain-containing protein n=1 Tax=Minwuia thermotolerans TaxID=2056226 RepID=A0A2M9FX20_9PROT|nr:GYD domain-containing protein [Minwuia thermotolerans]PJK28006.1 hypothetical protein CVT23_19285 [Minwuia thermotolerans]
MAWYLTRTRLAPETVGALMNEPQDRSVQVGEVAEANGCKLHHMFWAMGDCDVVTLIEGPSDEDVMAVLMTIFAGGAANAMSTTKLIPMSDGVDILRTAAERRGDYKALTE